MLKYVAYCCGSVDKYTVGQKKGPPKWTMKGNGSHEGEWQPT